MFLVFSIRIRCLCAIFVLVVVAAFSDVAALFSLLVFSGRRHIAESRESVVVRFALDTHDFRRFHNGDVRHTILHGFSELASLSCRRQHLMVISGSFGSRRFDEHGHELVGGLQLAIFQIRTREQHTRSSGRTGVCYIRFVLYVNCRGLSGSGSHTSSASSTFVGNFLIRVRYAFLTGCGGTAAAAFVLGRC